MAPHSGFDNLQHLKVPSRSLTSIFAQQATYEPFSVPQFDRHPSAAEWNSLPYLPPSASQPAGFAAVTRQVAQAELQRIETRAAANSSMNDPRAKALAAERQRAIRTAPQRRPQLLNSVARAAAYGGNGRRPGVKVDVLPCDQ
jgi:hypothetical protein